MKRQTIFLCKRLYQRKSKQPNTHYQSGGSQQIKVCQSCLSSNASSSSVCRSCGFFMRSTDNISLSLAQHRGLVKKVDESKLEILSQSEWRSIENSLAEREDAYCPICMEGFNKGNEVLLSCTHMYHRYTVD